MNMRFMLAPLWLALSMTFGTQGFKYANPFFNQPASPLFTKYPLQNDLSKTILEAALKKNKGLLNLD